MPARQPQQRQHRVHRRDRADQPVIGRGKIDLLRRSPFFAAADEAAMARLLQPSFTQVQRP